ncbi:MAG: hypothetical protein GXY34_11310 [Syntrophomonadaceae bacterium]|nr:hypothetical protein [Syntrophomonadaceae bacterium]
MFKDLVKWEINFNCEDLFDLDAALREDATSPYGDAFSIPELVYSELDIFDSVTPGFSIDFNDVFGAAQSRLENDPQSAISALLEVGPADLLDINQVYTEIADSEAYHFSKVFTYEGVDIDSYDNVSISMPHLSAGAGNSQAWPTIFGEIESYVQQTITEDLSDVLISDLPSRPGMILVKGNRNNLINSFEGHNSLTQGQSFNIPMQFHTENGELFFTINLSEINFRDLSRMRHLPREMNMKSVLSLISKQSKAK